eukprot:15867221-Heterocapsa_arctica.AAC.1
MFATRTICLRLALRTPSGKSLGGHLIGIVCGNNCVHLRALRSVSKSATIPLALRVLALVP